MTEPQIIRLIKKIKTASWRELFEINWQMWDLEDEITVNRNNLRKVGELYFKLREFSKRRAKLKGEEKTY